MEMVEKEREREGISTMIIRSLNYNVSFDAFYVT